MTWTQLRNFGRKKYGWRFKKHMLFTFCCEIKTKPAEWLKLQQSVFPGDTEENELAKIKGKKRLITDQHSHTD